MATIAVGTAALQILNRNAGRKSVTIRNVSTGGQNIRFWLQDEKGLTLTNADYALMPNEEKTFLQYFDGNDMKNPIAAIADAAGGSLLVGETSEYLSR
jgi:hypothetical protein